MAFFTMYSVSSGTSVGVEWRGAVAFAQYLRHWPDVFERVLATRRDGVDQRDEHIHEFAFAVDIADFGPGALFFLSSLTRGRMDFFLNARGKSRRGIIFQLVPGRLLFFLRLGSCTCFITFSDRVRNRRKGQMAWLSECSILKELDRFGVLLGAAGANEAMNGRAELGFDDPGGFAAGPSRNRGPRSGAGRRCS